MSLAAAYRMATNPARFAEAAGIIPDAWQRKLLRSRAPRILVNCSRQSGKSSTVAIIGIHQAIYTPGSLTLLLSPTQRQSGELFKKVLTVYRALGRPVKAQAETALTLELENGSRIVALPGNEGTIRGYSGVNLLLLDEASRVEDDLYASVRPMLAVSGGRLIAASTPFGTRGFWYEAWIGNEPWERYEVPATECPRISAEFLEEERRTIGDFWFEQEYGCQFLDAQSSAFRSADIERMFSDDVALWDFGPSPSAAAADVTPTTPAALAFSAYQQQPQPARTALDDELEEMERQRSRAFSTWYGGL